MDETKCKFTSRVDDPDKDRAPSLQCIDLQDIHGEKTEGCNQGSRNNGRD
jgi:hypothetical protein